jgi:hypothetical protein
MFEHFSTVTASQVRTLCNRRDIGLSVHEERQVLRVNSDRVLADLKYLRTIGSYKTGVHRPTLSPEDIFARQWLVERMITAGLDARIDGIGNILGTSDVAGRIMLAG